MQSNTNGKRTNRRGQPPVLDGRLAAKLTLRKGLLLPMNRLFQYRYARNPLAGIHKGWWRVDSRLKTAGMTRTVPLRE